MWWHVGHLEPISSIRFVFARRSSKLSQSDLPRRGRLQTSATELFLVCSAVEDNPTRNMSIAVHGGHEICLVACHGFLVRLGPASISASHQLGLRLPILRFWDSQQLIWIHTLQCAGHLFASVLVPIQTWTKVLDAFDLERRIPGLWISNFRFPILHQSWGGICLSSSTLEEKKHEKQIQFEAQSLHNL